MRTAVDFSLERIFRLLTFFRLGQTRLVQTRPVQTRPEQMGPDKTRPDKNKSDNTRQDQTRPDQTRPDQTSSDQTRSKRAKPGCAVRTLDSDHGSVGGSNVMDSRSCTMYSQNTSAS